MKQCKRCKKIKALDLFYKQKSTKDGYAMFCGECARVSNKARYHNGSIKRNVIPGFQFRSAGLKKVTPLYLWQIVGQKQYKYGRIKPDNVDKWKIIGTYWAYENDF